MGSNAQPAAPALSGIRFGRAFPSDLPEIVAMERRCYGDPWPATAFASLPRNEQVLFQVAREDAGNRLVGYAVAWYVLDEGELANLAVAPEARGRGIGRVLLDRTLADAAARDIAHLYLEVRESNAVARHLYSTSGFVEVGRRKQYYRSPVEDALILRRTLKR